MSSGASCLRRRPGDIAELLPQLEARAVDLAESAARRLAERGAREARELRDVLEAQRARVAAQLERHEREPEQLALDFSAEEKRQLQANMAAWRRRLAQFDAELEREPARVRAFYEVQATRVEPVGLRLPLARDELRSALRQVRHVHDPVGQTGVPAHGVVKVLVGGDRGIAVHVE